MVDIKKVIDDSFKDDIQQILAESKGSKQLDEDDVDRLIQLLLRHSSHLLKYYHSALQKELANQDIHI